jgi:glucokinase
MTVSGGALQRNFEALTGKKLTAEQIVALSQTGDTQAKDLVDEFVHGLGFSITWLASTIAPEVVVLAGGLATSGDFLKNALNEQLTQMIGIQLKPEIRLSTLGGNSGCIGAGLVAHNRMK